MKAESVSKKIKRDNHKKSAIILLLLGSALLSIMAFRSTRSNKLTLEFTIEKSDAAIGYANIYGCKITEVKQGQLSDKTISMTIMAGKLESFFSKHAGTLQKAEATFTLHKKREAYNHAPINGFVDDGKTSWEMTSIKMAE
jgi:hypothetical protein